MVEKAFLKDPDAVLDYVFDWITEDWLETGETISTYVITVDIGLTKDTDNKSDGSVTVWLSGGTAGTDYTVACKITTSMGRVDERSIKIRCRSR